MEILGTTRQDRDLEPNSLPKRVMSLNSRLRGTIMEIRSQESENGRDRGSLPTVTGSVKEGTRGVKPNHGSRPKTLTMPNLRALTQGHNPNLTALLTDNFIPKTPYQNLLYFMKTQFQHPLDIMSTLS